jgi:hypothetical protein
MEPWQIEHLRAKADRVCGVEELRMKTFVQKLLTQRQFTKSDTQILVSILVRQYETTN